jgi:WD40 repeat protein
MQRLWNLDFGEPVAKVRLHPHLPRLIAFSGARDNAFLCGWDDTGIRRISTFGSGTPHGTATSVTVGDKHLDWDGFRFVGDVAFHPTQDVMALVGVGRPIEIRCAVSGSLVRMIGDTSSPIELVHPGLGGRVVIVPPQLQGYGAILFSRFGHLLLAVPLFDEEASIFEPRTQVFRYPSGELFTRLGENDTCLARVPNGNVVAAVRNEYTDCQVRFFAIKEPASQSSDEGLAITEFYPKGARKAWAPLQVNVEGITFSSNGDALALLGGLPCGKDRRETLSLHSMTGLEPRAKINIPLTWRVPDEVRKCLPLFPIERVGYSHQRRAFIVPGSEGELVWVDATTGDETKRATVHSDLVSSVDCRAADQLIVTSSWDGSISCWAEGGAGRQQRRGDG